MPKKCKFLQKQRIFPVAPTTSNISVVDLVTYYTNSGAFNGGRLAEACAIYEAMLRDKATIGLTMAGALTPTGLGGFITRLIKRGLIDFIISTGANLYHDVHFALNLPLHQGDFRVDDTELLHDGVVRIYDVFLPEETLLKTDTFVQKTFDDFSWKTPISTAQVHYILGKKLLEKAAYPEYSILATAAQHDVPVFTSSPGDSSIGMNLALLKLLKHGVTVDTDLDVLETTAIVFNSKKNGAIELGGGSPKNFYMQTQPMLNQIMNIDKGGHDYFIQITTDTPQYGGLSGATPAEAVSWKKINPHTMKNDVVVYCDVTIAAPLLFSYILSKQHEQPAKRLYTQRETYVAKLTKAYKK